MQFKSATIRSCLFYSNFLNSFSYCIISYQVGVFSVRLQGVSILVFAPLLHSWLSASKPKAMNEIISTSDRFLMTVSGPSCCGKTELIFKMLLNNTFSPKLQSFFCFYQHEKPKFESLERKMNIQFKKFTIFEVVSEIEECLLVFDDPCDKIFSDKLKSFQNLRLQVVTKI